MRSVANLGYLKAFSTPPHFCCRDNETAGKPTDLFTTHVCTRVTAGEHLGAPTPGGMQAVPHALFSSQRRAAADENGCTLPHRNQYAADSFEHAVHALRTTQAGMSHALTCQLVDYRLKR